MLAPASLSIRSHHFRPGQINYGSLAFSRRLEDSPRRLGGLASGIAATVARWVFGDEGRGEGGGGGGGGR
jgi:hypothetical protein